MTVGASEGQPRAPRSDPRTAAEQKAELRVRLRAARAARPRRERADEARTVRALAACAGAQVVAAYVSVPGEPDTWDLIEQLRLAEVPVLLPVLSREPDWAWYSGPEGLQPGPRGIPRPSGPALGAEALRLADWIWLPGLAGTQDGHRLGTGGGWYDRALAWSSPTSRRGLLLFDDEVLPQVPVEAWDRDVHLLVTERRRLDCGGE